ncbi:MAG: hypothetical protein QOE36_1978, partial [Gaiellaceae bacterium]|nr:hypothetical protein [Gaiellaceae bacterium]
MNGGLASPAARRSAAPESASRSRAESASRAPVRQPPAAILTTGRDQVPGTRERMRASFAPVEPAGPAAIRLLGPVVQDGPLPDGAPAPALAVVPPAADALTTRDRIVNRALATPEAAPTEPAAVVVDIADLQDRRRQREPDSAPPAPALRPSLAPVIPLVREPKAARAPPVAAGADTGPARGPAVASAAPARAPPEAKPEVSAAPASPETKGGGPEASGAPTRAGPEEAPGPVSAPASIGPEAGPAAAAAPSAEPSLAAPGAAQVPAAAPEGAAAPQPATADVAPEAVAPAAAPPVTRNPEDDPAFQAMKERARGAGTRTKHHQPGTEGAATAQGASEPDRDKDVRSQAADAQVQTMEAQKPGPFDPADFKRQVKEKVDGIAPPATLDEADDYEKSGKAGAAAGEIQTIVSSGKAASANDIKTTTEAPLDPSGMTPKPVSKMVNDAPGPPLPDVGASEALPGPRPAEEIDLSAGPLQIDAKLTEANVTEEQLTSANEPEFTSALDARQEVRDHAAADPVQYRTQEELVLAGGRVASENAAAKDLEGMHGSRTGTLSAVLGKKDATKLGDQKLRDDIHASILDIHTRTQQDVQTILATLDTTVDSIFTTGEKAARRQFEDDVDRKMTEYKDDRYSGPWGGYHWIRDKFKDLPEEVNVFYSDGRANYLAAMDRVIEEIATVVGMLLAAAQLRIEAGREEVRTYVQGLDDSARKLGEETAGDLDNRFDQLSADVDAKRDELVDTVAHKYVESRDDLDSRIKELQEANKGLISKAIDAVVGVLKTIYELGKLLLRVLLKAASAIGDIVAHPIRFLGNLVEAVKGGLDRFVSRIGIHLQESLVDLLFGELGSAGITIPKQLDFAGIVDLVLQVLGLTYANVRERVVKRFGEPAVARMEQTVDIFTTLAKEGVAGLWTWISEKLTDLEDLVIGKIKEYVAERVVKAGIGYIVALLNPAAAFIKACQGIYQIVMFIVDKAKQIAEFVDAILDSISAIAQGDVGRAVEKVESALAGGLTLAIGFLARLANLGGIAEKVRSIIAAIRKPITRVVDGIVFGAADVFRRTLGPAVAFGKAKVQSGRDWARGKAEKGKAWALQKAEGVKVRLTGRDLARAPPAEAAHQPHPDDEPAQPTRVAEDRIDVAPGEQHVVFAQLTGTGQIDLGLSSTPQLVTDLVGHFEPRIPELPATAPARPPKGGRKGDQPRIQAQSAAERIVRRAGKLEQDFERDYDARRALHHSASFKGFASVYHPAPGLTSQF